MLSIIQSLPFWAQVALLCVPSLSAIFAGFGLIQNVRQSRRTNAQTRSTLVAECLSRFANDIEMQNAFYSIEYGKFKYDDGFHGSQKEREVDKLLRHFANLALSWQAGLLTNADVRPIHYYLMRITSSPEIQAYLEFIDNWSKQLNLRDHPFSVLSKLSQSLERKYATI